MNRVRKAIIALLRAGMGRHEEASATGLWMRAWMMRHVPGQLTCIEFESFIHDYQEGALSPAQRRAFDLHMELCPMCHVYLASYLRTIELGRRICASEDRLAPASLPEGLVSAILAARSAG